MNLAPTRTNRRLFTTAPPTFGKMKLKQFKITNHVELARQRRERARVHGVPGMNEWDVRIRTRARMCVCPRREGKVREIYQAVQRAHARAYKSRYKSCVRCSMHTNAINRRRLRVLQCAHKHIAPSSSSSYHRRVFPRKNAPASLCLNAAGMRLM